MKLIHKYEQTEITLGSSWYIAGTILYVEAKYQVGSFLFIPIYKHKYVSEHDIVEAVTC